MGKEASSSFIEDYWQNLKEGIMNYKHKVQYYETDMMGITHHSNYVRWMEEARIEFMKDFGWDYSLNDEFGISAPVISSSCEYKKTTTFGDVIEIEVLVEEYNSVRLKFLYFMYNAKGDVVCIGRTTHCFLSKEGRIIIIKKVLPSLEETLLKIYSLSKETISKR